MASQVVGSALEGAPSYARGAALALIRKFRDAEVSANLHRLKQVKETGSLKDRSCSVAGEFDPFPN